MSDLAEGATAAANQSSDRAEVLMQWIMHHVNDSHEWHPLPGIGIHLPDFISLHGLMLLLCAGFLIFLFKVLYKHGPSAPTGVTNLLELFVIFVRDEISIACLGEEDGKKMTPMFCSFFFFILALNLMGLIPLFATATSNISVTFALASISMGFMIFGGIYKNGPVGFAKAFVPQGIPWPILLIVTPLEFLGVFIKSFALMIRLFANMLAGHIVVFSILGLIFTFGYVALPAVVLAIGISLLEIFIALLQAYIFTLLSALFIGQIYHPAH